MKVLYVAYGSNDIAFEVRNVFLFPWLEAHGFKSSGKDDDEWVIADSDAELVESEIARLNQKYEVELYADYLRRAHAEP